MNITNIPKKIYLQVDEDFTDFISKDVRSVTWCTEKINDDDIEYIKSDLYNEMLKVLIEINKLALCSDDRFTGYSDIIYLDTKDIIEKATGLKIEEILKEK